MGSRGSWVSAFYCRRQKSPGGRSKSGRGEGGNDYDKVLGLDWSRIIMISEASTEDEVGVGKRAQRESRRRHMRDYRSGSVLRFAIDM